MRYLGEIQDPKDLVTKEYVDNAISALPDKGSKITTNMLGITPVPSYQSTAATITPGLVSLYYGGAEPYV